MNAPKAITKILCPECAGEMEVISDCCGAKMDTDLMLCYSCRDHCEQAVCETCGGRGEVEVEI